MSSTGQDTATGVPDANQRSDVAPPDEIRVSALGAELSLLWNCGRQLTFPAPFLRDNSQSAGSKKLRLSGLAVPAPCDIRITGVHPIGSYAINIVFSDGYDRGIYPWVFLQRLAAEREDRNTQEKSVLSSDDFLKGN